MGGGEIRGKMRAKKPINFEIRIIDTTRSGLSTTVTVGLLNVGNFDAHRVQLKLEAFCHGERIKLDGRAYLAESLGTLRARQWVTKTRTIAIGLWDGSKIQGRGATLKLTIYSDEAAKTISYYYQP